MTSKSPSREGGETLVEILIAIMIIGITATGLIAGLSTSIFASDAHRRISSAESVLREYGELLKDRVIHPAATTITADVATFSAGDSVTIPVLSTAAFSDSGNFTVSLDGAIMTVTSQTSTSFTTRAGSAGTARSGATVQRYESCPDATYFDPILAEHPELSSVERLAPPTVKSVAFYDASNVLVASCTTFHDAAGTTPCSLSTDWRTECDPAWMSIDIEVVSTDTGRSTTKASTKIIIRRVP